jgi:hypothetical protein
MNVLPNTPNNWFRSLSAIYPSALLAGLLLLAACDTSSNAERQPKLAMSTNAVQGSEAVVAGGDTVLFEPLRSSEAPCFDPRDCDLPPLNIEVTSAGIQIGGGYFLSPWGAHTLESEIERTGDSVTITIHPPRNEVHTDILDPFLYEAQLTNLEPGVYQLRMVHENDAIRTGFSDENYRAVVVDRQVTVP